MNSKSASCKKVSPVTMSRNKRYEQRQNEKGLIKKTLWVPKECEVEVEMTVRFLCENRDHVPYMARSLKTGKMRKID